MKKLLLVACLSLVALAWAPPPAQAGGRFFVSFGFGFGGGYHRFYRPWYPYAYPAYAYPYYPYAYYPYYGPYYGALRTYVYAPPVRYYVAPFYTPYRAYTIRVPRRVQAPVQRDLRRPGSGGPQRAYGQYVPRRYGR
ncbi:MAG: hypothetical protein LAP85_00810 [Acidobacteriia bacterium]|nr:hypothetical protein [Terriglobia bacterium]